METIAIPAQTISAKTIAQIFPENAFIPKPSAPKKLSQWYDALSLLILFVAKSR